MTDTYSEGATWDTPVTGPSNGEVADAETSVTTPVQALVNRTGYLYAIIRPSTGSGVTRVRDAATTAAMKALNNNTAGDLVLVAAGVGGSGMYRFVAGSAVGVDITGQIYACTGSGTTGNWEILYYERLDIGRGIPSLNTNAKVDATKLVNGLISINEDVYQSATTAATSSTSFVDALVSGHPALSFAVVAGDVLDIAVSFNWVVTGTGGGFWQLLVHDGSDVVPTALQCTVTGSYSQGAGGGQQRVTVRGTYVVTTTGTLTMKIQHKVTAGTATSTIQEPASILCMQHRP